MVRPSPDSPVSQTHTRQAECHGRPPVTQASTDTDGVVIISDSSQKGLEAVGPAPSGPLCHGRKRKVAHVRLSITGGDSLEAGCSFLPVRWNVGLRLAPVPTDSDSHQEDADGTLHNGTNSTAVASSGVVPTSPGAVNRPPIPASTDAHPTAPDRVAPLPQQTRDSQPYAWRLSSLPYAPRASPLSLPAGLLQPTEPEPKPYTTVDGRSFVTGAQRGIWTLSRPLPL